MIGGIIGKGGSVVNGMMVTTQAKIKISQNHEIFPDTDERIALISGTFDNVNLAIYEIISKVCEVKNNSLHSFFLSYFFLYFSFFFFFFSFYLCIYKHILLCLSVLT